MPMPMPAGCCVSVVSAPGGRRMSSGAPRPAAVSIGDGVVANSVEHTARTGVATGGTVTRDGVARVHTFSADGRPAARVLQKLSLSDPFWPAHDRQVN